MDGSGGIWELPSQNFQTRLSPNHSNYIRNPIYRNGSVLPQTLGKMSMPPPIPPRPNNYSNIHNSQGPYGNNFNYGGYMNYGTSNYGLGYRPGFNAYSHGFGHNGYYSSNNPESRFIQLAEESSRPAFQAIQSVLQSFSSVAMMFDSTFNALYSSYMSVLSVADNIGKLRSSFGQVFSLLAVFKALYWRYRKLLYIIGISKINPETENLWVKALKGTNGNTNGETQKPWSTMLLLCIIVAGPYLLFKLMSRLYPSPNKENWSPVAEPGTTAVGVYDFQTSNDQELRFSANQKLMIAPEKYQPLNCPGWLLACDKDQNIGLVPKNYIGIVMRSEITGKPYLEHNGKNYEIINYVEPEKNKNAETAEKECNELFSDKGVKMNENVVE